MNRGARRHRHRLRPALQELEGRRLPATFTVTSTADTLTKQQPTSGTLRWAVEQADSATSPSTIAFQLTSMAATITLTQGALALDNTSESITIDGPGQGLLSISGNRTFEVFRVAAGVTATLSGLTITQGSSSSGGGLDNDGSATLSDCTISNNSAPNGGGLYNGETAMLSVTDCTISGNSAQGGGGLGNVGTVTIQGGTISGNSVALGGGGLFSFGMATLSDCTISGNSAKDGGGMEDSAGTATIDACTIKGNSAAKYGGGLYNLGMATVAGGTISDNVAYTFGGVDNETGATLNVSNCTISGNSAPSGAGGLGNSGTATFDDCTIKGNSAGAAGGLDQGQEGTLSLSDCTISGNSAGEGGGLGSEGMATLDGCTISGNSAYNGGGLLDIGTAKLDDCTISGNSAGHNSGGLYIGGTATLDGCTISGNSAGDYGGGLQVLGTATLGGCTISGNSAGNGGGLSLDLSGAATLTDTIVAGNHGSGGADIELGYNGSNATGSNNLIGTGGSGGIQGGSDGNIVLTSLTGLGLAPLGNYGGPTRTIALLPGSPAIGAGTSIQGITTDQRGEPIGASVDIGAFQSQGFTIEPVGGSTAQSAAIDATFPLAVTVTANNPVEPVAGGVVTFSVTPGPTGASANLSGTSAIIGTDGVAQVNATSNGAIGPYVVTATAAGASPTQLRLSNIPAITRIHVFPFLFYRKKKEKKATSIGLEVEIEPTSSGGDAPNGIVTFKLGRKTLGMVSLVGGEATLMVKPSRVLNKSITIVYGGDADFLSSAVVPPVLTRKSLKGLTRPMIEMFGRTSLRHRGHRSPTGTPSVSPALRRPS